MTAIMMNQDGIITRAMVNARAHAGASQADEQQARTMESWRKSFLQTTKA